VKNNAGSDKFAFTDTFDLEQVFNTLHQIKSNAIGVPLKFLKLILPQVLGTLNHIYITILTTSIYPLNAHCQKSEPSHMSNYRPISVLPAFSKAIEIIIKRQINAF
jgi:hypothetical protein